MEENHVQKLWQVAVQAAARNNSAISPVMVFTQLLLDGLVATAPKADIRDFIQMARDELLGISKKSKKESS